MVKVFWIRRVGECVGCIRSEGGCCSEGCLHQELEVFCIRSKREAEGPLYQERGRVLW